MTSTEQLSKWIYRGAKITAFALISMTALGSKVLAQQNAHKIDSLEMLLPASNDSVRSSILGQLSLEFIDVDNTKAIAYGNRGLKVAWLAKDTMQIAELSSITSTALRSLYKMDSAILLGKQSLYFATKKHNSDLVIRAHNGLGLAYLFQGRYDSALIHNFQNLELIKRLKESGYAKHSLANIGLIYYKLGDHQRALHFLARSLDLLGQVEGEMTSGVNLNMALCYRELKEFKKSKTHIDSAFKLCRGGSCPDYYRSTIYNALGLFFFDQKKYDSAIVSFVMSNSLAEENNTRMLLENTTFLASIETKRNNYPNALNYLKRAEGLLANEISMPKEEVQLYSIFSEVYEKIGDKKSAVVYMQKYLEAKDSIYTVGLTNNIMQTTVSYYQKDNEELIKSQSNILKLREKIMSGQRLLNVFIIGVAISLFILGATLILFNRRKQILNQELDDRVRERTKDLEQSHIEMIKTLQQQEILMKKNEQRITGLLTTISGICDIGLKEPLHEASLKRFREINNTSKALLRRLNNKL